MNKCKEWSDDDLLEANTGIIVIRKKVYGGWLIYRDIVSQRTDLALTSTVVFISDPNHEWKLEITD